MKAIEISTNNVLKQTIKCLGYSMDLPTSLGKGFMIETLKKRMMRGEVVRFCYQKLSGEIRYAIGTLQSDAVMANITGTGIPKRFYGMFAYIDLQKMQWRGFKEERLIGIVD
jgi:hypothetical protein